MSIFENYRTETFSWQEDVAPLGTLTFDSRADRTCRIIENNGFILLKRRDGWYLHQHTNLAAGTDSAVWGKRDAAMHFDSIEWAFIVAKHYESTVVTYYPDRRKRT